MSRLAAGLGLLLGLGLLTASGAMAAGLGTLNALAGWAHSANRELQLRSMAAALAEHPGLVELDEHLAEWYPQ